MAAKGLDINTDAFSCSICLDLLNNPVTIPCGHSYCMSCVDSHWNEEKGKQSYSCPQCRHCFTQRPVLVKNTMLDVLMEGIKKSRPPAAVCPSSAAHGDVFCDLCSGKKMRAVKSCLQCLVSYCKEHLQPHYDVAALKKHKLVEPSESLRENICPRHDEVMKMFCRTDQQCICYLCSVDQHKDHHTVTAAAERAEKQRELQVYQQDIAHRLDHKQKDMDHLQQQLKNNERSFNAALELQSRELKKLVALLTERMHEVTLEVNAQWKAEEYRRLEIQDIVELELFWLKKRHTDLDKLSHTEDHVQFLLKFPSLSNDSENSTSVNHNHSGPPLEDIVTAASSKLRSVLQKTSLIEPPTALHKSKANAPKTNAPPAGAQATAPPQQTSKEFPALPQNNLKPTTTAPDPPPMPYKHPCDPEYLSEKKFFRKLTWDPRSVHDQLQLYDENYSVRRMQQNHNYFPHVFRFTSLHQAVSKERLTGKCYFEVMVFMSNYKSVTVAVTYKDIKREGSSDECSFGKNAKSWALQCFNDHCVFWHNGEKLMIPKEGVFVGVFVDYQAGVLKFYRKHDDALAVITSTTTFTGPLLAGVRLDPGGVGALSKRVST